MTSPVETFPKLEVETSNPNGAQYTYSPDQVTPLQAQQDQQYSAASNGNWQARRASHVKWEERRAKGIPASRHRSRKSISEALETIRTRQGSVSAGAHELADALKAPVSYKLVVSAHLSCRGSVAYLSNLSTPDPQRHLVFDFCADQYVI